MWHAFGGIESLAVLEFNARLKTRQIIAAVERELVYLLGSDHAAASGVFGVDTYSLRANLD